MNKLVLTFLVLQIAAVDKIKARRDAGQGTLEYVGMIAVAALIVVGLLGVAKQWEFATIVTDAITSVKSKVGG